MLSKFFILLLFLLNLGQSIPLDFQTHTLPTNLTYHGNPYCTHSIDWVRKGYLEEDCVDAIARLQHTDYILHGYEQFEFLGRGAKAVYGLPAMRTPRRYTFATCTVVIAMLNSFPPGLLPDEPPRLPYGFSDAASFADLWSAARRIDHLCLGTHNTLGWAMGGTINHAIGVFIWATESALDRIVPHHKARELVVANNRSVSSALLGDR